MPDLSVDSLFSAVDSEFGLVNQLDNKEVILNYEGTAPNGRRTAIINTDSVWVGFPNLGKLHGNSMVVVNGENVHIHGNVYGGGKAGALEGNSTVVVKAGTIDGNVYGAGKGEDGRPEKAKVSGSSKVIVDKDWTE